VTTWEELLAKLQEKEEQAKLGGGHEKQQAQKAKGKLLCRERIDALVDPGSFAEINMQAGVHIKVVQERLGHSSIRVMLDTYSHLIGGLQEAAAQRFDDFLTPRLVEAENVSKRLRNKSRGGRI